MIQYRYNELKYAEKILKDGFMTHYHRYELKILVKYYKEIQNKKASERKELVYAFCQEHIEKFNRVKYFRIINSALLYGSKRLSKLITIESIPITENEIKYINGLELDEIHKKILFTFIVKNKLNKEMSKQIYGKSSEYNFFGGKNESYKEVFEMSKLSNSLNINNIVNTLSNNGYVDVVNRGRINLLFIENIDVSEIDKIVMNITNFDNVGYYFDWYNGNDKFIRCENVGCEEVIKKTNGNMKYCTDCAKEKQFNQKKEWDKTKRIRKADNPCIPTLPTV